MDDSRPTTPDAPPQDLWSSILDSVSSTRSIPSKQVLVLGPPGSGKSALASALLQRPIAADNNDASCADFALGYEWADVRDDGDEGAYRLSVLSPCHGATRYLGATVRVYGAVRCAGLYGPAAPFLALEDGAAAYTRHDRARLDASVDVHGGPADVAQVGRAVGKRGRLARS